MPTIVTLTLNPAIDVSTSTERVEPTRKLRCRAGRRDAGGGGINVARVVHRLGAEAVAIYPAGGFVGQLLRELVEKEGVRSVPVPVAEETREDFTVLDETTHQEFRFVLPGPRLRGVEWMACLKALAGLQARPAFVCASGSLPPGAPDDFYARVAEIVASWGVRLALDTSGPPLRAALQERVFLIKPNLRELRELAGAPLDDEASLIAVCRGLIARGRAEVVALTLGEEGALMVTADGAWRAQGLPIRRVSSVGAGDSFLGSMVWALAAKKPLDEAFRYGMAGGSAALRAAGTELAQAGEIRRLLPQVQVEALPATARRARADA